MMQPTKRLFDIDSHLFRFSARVLAVEEKQQGILHVVLDETAFFPEGGGQYADEGSLAGCRVLDVQEHDGVITHTVEVSGEGHPFRVSATVEGQLEEETRMIRMQNHTAEHILSGIIHRRYGLNNVGFHLGNGDITFDFDGVLTRAQLDEAEREANRLIRACLPVRASYPTKEELAAMSYRCKPGLTENIRIVEIGEHNAPADRCACCAPHVGNTGEIGVVKLLDFQHYKGGIRIHMLAGEWALLDYRTRYNATAAIAAALSVRQDSVVEGFERMRAEAEEKRQTTSRLRERVQTLTVAAIEPRDGSICYFEEGLEAVEMRHLLNQLKKKCTRLCGVFSGSDQTGYRFVIGRASADIDLKKYAEELSEALLASGGGSSEMQQGSAKASRAAIEEYFARF